MSSLATLFLFCISRSAAAVGGAGGCKGDVGGDARWPLAPPPMVPPFIYWFDSSLCLTPRRAGDVASLAALACRRVCVPSALAAVDERIAATQSALDVPRLAAICEDRRVQRLDCED